MCTLLGSTPISSMKSSKWLKACVSPCQVKCTRYKNEEKYEIRRHNLLLHQIRLTFTTGRRGRSPPDDG